MCSRKNAVVYIGYNDIHSDEWTRQTTGEFIVHPEYDAVNITNDVALIHLHFPLLITSMD